MKGFKNGIGATTIETRGYPIQEFKKVTASDVNGISYFADNIDESIKSISYYDLNGKLIKKEVFTYGSVLSDLTVVKKIYCIYDEVHFKGIISNNTVPATPDNGDWLIVEGSFAYKGISYADRDIIGYFVYGESSTPRWGKAIIGEDGNLESK